MASRAVLWLGGTVFVISLATCTWWYVFVLGRASATFSLRALAADAALFTIFALHHSLFARDFAKRLFGSLTPQAMRSLYVYVASGLLIAVCVAWRPIGGELYRASGGRAAAHITAQLAGLWCIARAVARIDPLELAGIRPQTGRDRLQRGGVYGWVRHPIYFGWVIAAFATPHMTGDRMAFAAISTLYLVAAVPFEERSLRRSFGEEYARYAREVRWRIVPFIY